MTIHVLLARYSPMDDSPLEASADCDGNNEGEYRSIAAFLIEELGRFERFKEHDLDSHMPSVETYARMHRVFLPMKRGLGMGVRLTADQLIELTKARIHPEHRGQR